MGDSETAVQEAVGCRVAERAFPEAAAEPQAPSGRDVVSASLCLELAGLRKGASVGLCRSGFSSGHTWGCLPCGQGWHADRPPAPPCRWEPQALCLWLWGRRGRTCRLHWDGPWDGPWKGPELEGPRGPSQHTAPVASPCPAACGRRLMPCWSPPSVSQQPCVLRGPRVLFLLRACPLVSLFPVLFVLLW